MNCLGSLDRLGELGLGALGDVDELFASSLRGLVGLVTS